MLEINLNLKLFSVSKITYGYSIQGQRMWTKYFLAEDKSELENIWKNNIDNSDNEEPIKFVIQELPCKVLNKTEINLLP